ncbi:MAG TPA: hypothetical protein ENI99_05785 [Sedimenticola sp.]|nr:hypothetical protein [Sedimenticola sp.]
MVNSLLKKSWILHMGYLCAGLVLSSCAMLPETFYDLDSKSSVPTKALPGRLGSHPVIFVGETHDSDIDHAMQLEVIRRLQESGRPLAVGLEMAPASSQPLLDDWVRGRISEEQFARAFDDMWAVPYAYYQDIFTYARGHGIRLVGLNLSRERFQKISKYGVGAELVRTLRDLKFRSCAQETEYALAMRTYLGRLSHKGDFNRLCDTQRFREAFMAKQIAGFLDTSDEMMVVLAGSAHAQRNALPEMLRRRGKQGYLIMLPDNFGDLMGGVITKKESDFVW